MFFGSVILLLPCTVALEIQSPLPKIVFQTSKSTVKTILSTFTILEEKSLYNNVSSLFSRKETDLKNIYNTMPEPENRVQQFIPFLADPQIQQSLLSPEKLFAVPSLARLIFVEKKVDYQPNLLAEYNFWKHKNLKHMDLDVLESMVHYAAKHQLGKLETLRLFEEYIPRCSSDKLTVLFDILSSEMFPELLYIFLPKAAECENDILERYLAAAEPTDLFKRLAIAIMAASKDSQLSNPIHGEAIFRALKRLDHEEKDLLLDFMGDLSGEGSRDDIQEEIYLRLEQEVQTSCDRSLLGALTFLVLSCPDAGAGGGDCEERVERYLETSPPEFLVPMFTKSIGEDYLKGDPSHRLAGQFFHLDPPFLPWILNDLDIRMNAWLQSGIFYRKKKVKVHCSYAETDQYVEEIATDFFLEEKGMPINFNFVEPSEKVHFWIGQALIELADSHLRALFPDISESLKSALPFSFVDPSPIDKIQVIMASWPFLVLSGNKLDLSFFFHGMEDDECWEEYIDWLEEKVIGTPEEINSVLSNIQILLDNMKLEKYFTPAELASLIHKPREEIRSNLGEQETDGNRSLLIISQEYRSKPSHEIDDA